MARKTTFTFRISNQERCMLKRLAKNLQRSQSDAVRLLIREAVTQLETAVSGQIGEQGEADDDHN